MVSNKAELEAELQAIEDRKNGHIFFDTLQDINSAGDEYARQFRILMKERKEIGALYIKVRTLLTWKKTKKIDASKNLVTKKYELEFGDKTILAITMKNISLNHTDITVYGFILNSFQDPEIPLIRTWFEIDRKSMFESEEKIELIRRFAKQEIGDYDVILLKNNYKPY